MNVTRLPSKRREFLELHIEAVDVSYVSALRRIAQADVPVLAIDHLEVIRNDTSYDDTYLLHRFGLLTINSDYASRVLFQLDCTCRCIDENCAECRSGKVNERKKHKCAKRCPSCSVEYRLHIRNDTPLVSREQLAYTHRVIECSDPRFQFNCLYADAARETAAYFAHDGLPEEAFDFQLLSLGPGQELEVRMYARKAIGYANAKWSCARAWFSNRPRIQAPESGRAAITECPNGAYTYSNDMEDFTRLEPERCVRCGICEDPKVHKGSASESMRIDELPESFDFHLQALGQLPPESILQQSAAILVEKIENIMKAFSVY